MTQMFEKAAEINKTGMAKLMKTVSTVSKTNQTAGIEWADFAKESYAAGSETMKKLAGARTLQAAMEIQGAYLKASFERLQSQAKVMSDLYQGLAKDVGAPLAGDTATFDPKAFFDTKTFFDPKAFFDTKTFFDPKAFFDAKNFPKFPAVTAPKLAA
ncbi:phasin family protein [Methylobacterium sp. J-078]|uniref:phasin family protein n=1 Tax=Methylobacterium sp. J-078 TaxID=2836657 RepID=UPI001FB96A09|nr:phasin family protein [Methylobacterium sp. J-078]MCJ2044787.1 phasin family protein [Methylobacterium sp. J-078]